MPHHTITLLGAAALLGLPLWYSPALAQSAPSGPSAATADEAPRVLPWPKAPSLNFYGAPGLIDMPSAEMLPDAQFANSVSRFAGQTRFNLQVQALPWATVAFRYSVIEDRNLFGFGDYYDRNFDVRFRLLKEGRHRPAVALGLQDFAGTGIFGGEYLVATKGFELPQIPGQFKVTTGLGWGRLATSGAIASFGTRPGFTSGDTGGELSVDQWFRGDIAPFGGIEWTHGKWGFKAEYSSDIYDQETRQSNVFDRRSSLNFGVEYQASRQLRLGAYYLYGDAIGITAQLQLNPRHPPTPLQIPAPYPVVPRSAWAKDDALWAQDWASRDKAKQTLRQALSEAMAAQNLILESVTFDATEAEVRFRNTEFRSETMAVGRAARAMAATLPASVETFHIVQVSRGIGLSRVSLRRSDLEALEFAPNASDALWAVTGVT